MKGLRFLAIPAILLTATIGIMVCPSVEAAGRQHSDSPASQVYSITSSNGPTGYNSNTYEDKLQAAAGFLNSLYVSGTGLCREDPEKNTCWVASDNYLASLALEPAGYYPDLAGQIKAKCSQYYTGKYNTEPVYYPYQIMEGKEIPFTLSIDDKVTLATINVDGTIYDINYNYYDNPITDSTYLDFPIYGDILVYQALNYYVRGYPLAWCRNLYDKAYQMFNGTGVADEHFRTASTYDNMKLALLIFGAKVLGLHGDPNFSLTNIESQLWNAQNGDGSITSCMDVNGDPVGTANCETTAFTLLAYDDALIQRIQQKRIQAEFKNTINWEIPAADFNNNGSLTKNVVAVPLINNWQITCNNTVQWNDPTTTPNIGLTFFSCPLDIPNSEKKEIKTIELVAFYDQNYSLDIKLPGSTDPITIQWASPSTEANPLTEVSPITVSLSYGRLTIFSPIRSCSFTLDNFPLAYIKSGSTEPNTCSGGTIELQISERAGDANGDGHLDCIDITKIERIIAGMDTAPDDGCPDANLDGEVNSVDVIRVKRNIAWLP